MLDPHRIRFDLTGSNDRELPLIIGTMAIFPAHATNPETFDKTSLAPPIGSGPYALTEVRPGERVVLKRRKDYWGEDLPITRGLYNFDEIRYDFYRDANSLFEAFKAGLYDFRIEGDPGQWATGYDIPAVRSGRIVRETMTTLLPKGMNGFVFNTRKPLFADIRVREALTYLFDFDWVNRNLYFSQLTRSNSYFSGSDLASAGRPADERERALLAPFPDAVRPDILDGRWEPPAGDGSGRDRDMARRALALLSEAGWVLENDVLRKKATKEAFAFEMLVNSRQQERLALNFSQSLQPDRHRGTGASRRRCAVLAPTRPFRVRHGAVALAGDAVPRQRTAQPMGLDCGAKGWVAQPRRDYLTRCRPAHRRPSGSEKPGRFRLFRSRPRSRPAVRILCRSAVLSERSMACLQQRFAAPGEDAAHGHEHRYVVEAAAVRAAPRPRADIVELPFM